MRLPWLFVAWCVAVTAVFGWAKEYGYDSWPFGAALYAAAASGGSSGGSGGWGGGSGSGGSGGGRSGSSSGSHK